MKLRLVAALASMAFLGGVAAHAALAGPPPAWWDRKNPAACPYPRQHEVPPCLDLTTPDAGARPVRGRS